jgi:hypothetical protein
MPSFYNLRDSEVRRVTWRVKIFATLNRMMMIRKISHRSGQAIKLQILTFLLA